jgi:hypothetical protein
MAKIGRACVYQTVISHVNFILSFIIDELFHPGMVLGITLQTPRSHSSHYICTTWLFFQ